MNPQRSKINYSTLLSNYLDYNSADFTTGIIYAKINKSVNSILDLSVPAKNLQNNESDFKSNKLPQRLNFSGRIPMYINSSNLSRYLKNDYDTLFDFSVAKIISGSNKVYAKYKRLDSIFTLLEFNSEKLSFLIESHEKVMYYASGADIYKYDKCLIPPTIMRLKLQRNDIELYEMIKMQNRNDYLVNPWPYGNVFNDGRVCTGSIKAENLLNFKNYITLDSETDTKIINLDLMVQMCYMAFFNTTFNHDLSGEKTPLILLYERYCKKYNIKPAVELIQKV